MDEPTQKKKKQAKWIAYFIVEDPKYREANTGDGFAFVPWTPSFVCAESGKVESNSIVASMSKNKNKVWHDTRVTIISLLIQVHLFSRPGLESMTENDTFRMHGERDLWFEYSSREWWYYNAFLRNRFDNYYFE